MNRNSTPSTFAFDCRNRLASVGNTSYTYNAENQRIGITENGIATNYMINPNAALSQTLIKTTGGVSTYYVYGLGLIAEETGTDYKTYHYDLRGSTVALTDNAGLVTDTFSYAPYGELLSHTGTSDVDYLYNGQDGVVADNNGLYQMRARYYSPELRRFLNEDEYAGKYDDILNVNLYAYCEGNPVGFVDPSGRTIFAVPFASGLTLNPAIELNPWIAPITGVWLYHEATKGLEDEQGGPARVDHSDFINGIKTTDSENQTNNDTEVPNVKYLGNNPAEAPGEDYEWRGSGNPENGKGNWYNPKTGESLHSDLDHPGPIGPHWDYKAPNGTQYRVNPDGTIVPK